LARMTALSLCAVLSLGGCQGSNSGQNVGFFGPVAKFRPAARKALDAGAGLLAGITYAIARYEATSRQRDVAERNAHRAFATHRADLRGRNVRYIAVRTSRSMRSSGGASCMLWDTQTQQLVGNNVYDCQNAPAPGSTTKFDSYSAEYVGL
jgi:hypothetical protein